MKQQTISEKIKKILNENGFWFEFFEHEPVRTSEEAEKLRPDYSLKQGIKALIVRYKNKDKSRDLAMVAIPGDARFNAKKVKKILGVKDVSFASEEEVMRITGGVKPGGVPPFGNLFDLPVYADVSILETEKIIFNASQVVSIAMKSEDYFKIVQPMKADIVM